VETDELATLTRVTLVTSRSSSRPLPLKLPDQRIWTFLDLPGRQRRLPPLRHRRFSIVWA